METSGYNLRQRPFLVSTTADSLATIATSSVSTVMSHPPIGSSSGTGGATSAPTYASANALSCSLKYVCELTRLCLSESFVLSILTYGCERVDLSTDNTNRLNVCWNDVYRKIFGFHRWESVKVVQLHCERLDLVRIVQLHRLKFLNRLFNSRNQVICQCLLWCWRSNGYRKLCNEYDILDCSPLRFDVFAKFKYVCEGR